MRGRRTGAVVSKNSRLYERIAPEGPSAILDAHLDLWWSESGIRQSLADVIAAAALFDGIVSMPLLRALRPDQSIPAVAERLIHSALFVPDGTGVRTVHGLMLDRMRERTARLPFRMQAIATSVLANRTRSPERSHDRQIADPVAEMAVRRVILEIKAGGGST